MQYQGQRKRHARGCSYPVIWVNFAILGVSLALNVPFCLTPLSRIWSFHSRIRFFPKARQKKWKRCLTWTIPTSPIAAFSFPSTPQDVSQSRSNCTSKMRKLEERCFDKASIESEVRLLPYASHTLICPCPRPRHPQTSNHPVYSLDLGPDKSRGVCLRQPVCLRVVAVAQASLSVRQPGAKSEVENRTSAE